MRSALYPFFLASSVSLSCLVFATVATAEKPSVEFALKLTPVQPDVDYDQPTSDEAKSCVLEAENDGAATSWVVRNAAGQILRKFQDTNGDNKVDRWCYFKNGVEVYRDIDADFNGKADQYRWLGTAGTRWGIDSNEDGRIDAWKVISPEEVTAEVVAALRDRDVHRFTRLLISPTELESLGLGEGRQSDIARKIEQAEADFAELAKSQSLVTPKSEWIHFGGSRPGVIAAGTDGAERDVYLYDNVSAIVETAGKNDQLAIGTLLRVGDGWRLIDLPANLVEDDADGFFFPASLTSVPRQATDGTPVDEKVQQLISDLDAVDQQLLAASQSAAARLHARRADLIQGLAVAAQTEDERGVWIRQLADTVSAAVQTGAFPDGLARLEKLINSISSDQENKNQDQLAYVKFRYLSAEYGQQLQDPDADYAKIQEEWLEKLNAYIDEFPSSPDAAEAMLQVAITHEFSGEEKEALDWYSQIASRFPKSPMAPKAVGAKRRLESVGKPFTLKGTTVDGRQLDIAGYRGKTVVVHYWATWCEPCKQDMATLRTLLDTYGKQGLVVIGVNLDSDNDSLRSFLSANRPAWHHLRESEGLDGRLANEMGILTLPTMLLIDKTGKVANRNLHRGELEQEIKRQLR